MRNFFDVLPDDLARRQQRWDLNQRIKIARDAGATPEEIGEHLQISGATVSQRARWAERENPVSPFEFYLALGQPSPEAQALVREHAQWVRDHREEDAPLYQQLNDEQLARIEAARLTHEQDRAKRRVRRIYDLCRAYLEPGQAGALTLGIFDLSDDG